MIGLAVSFITLWLAAPEAAATLWWVYWGIATVFVLVGFRADYYIRKIEKGR